MPQDVSHVFSKTSFTPATFDSVTFEVSWDRISAEDQAKMDAAQAERDAAEAQAKKDAAEAAKEQEQLEKERNGLWKACAVIYSRTINKKTGDLTVKETEQIQYCRSIDAYPPPIPVPGPPKPKQQPAAKPKAKVT